jgi:predicted short-subunit dehydrogenase-like oxidoreductase (DUF2520 family)
MARTVSIVGAGRVGISLGKRLRELGWRVGAVVTRSKSTARAAVRRIGAGKPFDRLTAVARRAGAPHVNPAEPGRRVEAWGFSPARNRELIRALAPGTRGKVSRGSELQLRHKLAKKIGALAPEDNAFLQLLASNLILIATPDDIMPAVAQSLADAVRAVAPRALRGKIVLHTSATLDRSALALLARLGASTGSLHPMQAFGGKVVPKLKGIIFGIEGDPKARRLAQSLAKSLGGIPVVIETADKPAYHAAAVMAGGSIYPVLEAGLQLLMSVGFTRERASQTLLPLLRQILDNTERIGPRAAWTGPLSRGDYAVVAKHMKALRRYPPEFAKSYAALAELAARVLSKDPASTLAQLDRALGNGSKV